MEETDAYRHLDKIPESLRMYAKFDTEQMARDMEAELYIVKGEDGGGLVSTSVTAYQSEGLSHIVAVTT